MCDCSVTHLHLENLIESPVRDSYAHNAPFQPHLLYAMNRLSINHIWYNNHHLVSITTVKNLDDSVRMIEAPR